MVQYLPIIVVLSFINVYMYLRLLKCEQCTCSESYDMYLMADTTGQAVTWSVQCMFSKLEIFHTRYRTPFTQNTVLKEWMCPVTKQCCTFAQLMGYFFNSLLDLIHSANLSTYPLYQSVRLISKLKLFLL